jgi:catechol 2,3-dioxygenase-like lactoylglutathione lyase family enzyme
MPETPSEEGTVQFRLCIDVPDLMAGLDFYTRALGLRPGRRRGDAWAEVLGAAVPLDLLVNAPGTVAAASSSAVRDYRRHWTPLHLDVVVQQLDVALARALSAGATLEREVQVRGWGRMANLADPFGNGFCLLEFHAQGYDAVLEG